MKLDSTITRAGSATGGTESHEAFAVGGSGRASGSQREVVQPFHAADGRDRILSLFVEIGQFPEAALDAKFVQLEGSGAGVDDALEALKAKMRAKQLEAGKK